MRGVTRITAKEGWAKRVKGRVGRHRQSDQEAGRYTDLTEAGYVGCLEEQGARCTVSWILFDENKWAPSMDRFDDQLGHNINPRNVAFIIRMFNTQIKFDRRLFLQMLLGQIVQPPTDRQRLLIEAELRDLDVTGAKMV